jgi:hypothetical protein
MIAEPRQKFPAVHVYCEMTDHGDPRSYCHLPFRATMRVPVFSGPHLPSVIGGPGLAFIGAASTTTRRAPTVARPSEVTLSLARPRPSLCPARWPALRCRVLMSAVTQAR